MKKILVLISVMICSFVSFAEENMLQNTQNVNFGNTLNLGVGIGYGSYGGIPLVGHYEISALHDDVTLGPSIGFGRYSTDQGIYSYTSTYLSLGCKGLYYFDNLMGLDDKFDIYAGATLGFTYWRSTWDDDDVPFDNDDIDAGTTPLWLGVSIGAEYKFNDKLGLWLDLGINGWSSIGLSIAMN